MDAAIISALITIFFGVIFSVVGYLLVQRDKQRGQEQGGMQTRIDATAALVLAEKEKTAALVLSENRLNAALILSERDKLAEQFKTEYKSLEKEFVEFRIKIAGEYATTTLVEKILMQITQPLVKKLDEIEVLLSTKLDRREYERDEARRNTSQQ